MFNIFTDIVIINERRLRRSKIQVIRHSQRNCRNLWLYYLLAKPRKSAPDYLWNNATNFEVQRVHSLLIENDQRQRAFFYASWTFWWIEKVFMAALYCRIDVTGESERKRTNGPVGPVLVRWFYGVHGCYGFTSDRARFFVPLHDRYFTR